ncbi:MAG TPA: DUF6788 family protein [Thermodesulfovibrionales bacterium]|nr:DUF6788 family protein [Thermodesulfovibrionales bacterium]
MQIRKTDIETLSRLRQDLQRLLEDLKRSVKVVFGRSSLVKGNVYEMARKCGKPSCACTRGELHRSMVLSWSHRGKTRLMSIPSERLAELRRKSEEYLRVRRARAHVSVLYKQILAVMDRIEKLRIEEP